jgi:vacuolar-type H+-ATPase subunit H
MLPGWLRRFLLAGVPGAPALAAVPLDKTSSLERELLPLLALLGDAERRATAVDEQFGLAALQLLDDAKARAEQLLDEARVSAGSARERAIAERSAAAQNEREDLVRRARTEAERVRQQSARETEMLVETVVALVLVEEPQPR